MFLYKGSLFASLFLMRMNNLIGISAILYILYKSLYSQYEKISYNLIGFNIVKFDYDGVTLAFDISLNNGSLFPLSVSGFDGKIKDVNGQEIAKLAIINPVNIPSKTSGRFKVGAKVMYANAAGFIASLLNKTGQSVVVISGRVYFSGGKYLPVRFRTQLW